MDAKDGRRVAFAYCDRFRLLGEDGSTGDCVCGDHDGIGECLAVHLRDSFRASAMRAAIAFLCVASAEVADSSIGVFGFDVVSCFFADDRTSFQGEVPDGSISNLNCF